ncbi:MAG: glycosyltransferase [Bacteroidota bacterium]
MSTIKPKILIIGDAEVKTGFARVITSIFTRIAEHYELHQLATHYSGGPHKSPWPLYKAESESDLYGYAQIPKLIADLDPDIIFLIYDLPYQVEYLKYINAYKGKFKIAIYSPLESGPIAPEIGMGLKGVSAFVVYTQYAQQEMKKCINKVKEEDASFMFPEIKVIPHAVDHQKFFPLSSTNGITGRHQARVQLFGEESDLLDSFIVFNGNRNQPRKRIDVTMEAFSIFVKDKPDNVHLFMHMGVQDRGWNIIALAKRYGIADRLIMMSIDNEIPTLEEEKLNSLYNACDVGVTTSTGEGWGLVSFEHAATGAAQIVPSHTALKELWEGSAVMVEPSYRLTYPGNLTYAWIVKPEDVAEAMEQLYTDSEYRKTIASKCYKNTQNASYNWDYIAKAWHQIFQDLL